jgi:hypothetical protein
MGFMCELSEKRHFLGFYNQYGTENEGVFTFQRMRF